VDFIRPRPLAPGETIGVVAPSSAVADGTERLEAGLAALEQLGFRVRKGRHLHDEWLGLAGSHQDRADDFNAMLRDPEVRMVMAAQGGFGCLAIVGRLDYTALRRDPKWVTDMSDLTVFLNALTAQSGVETLHGPDVMYSFGDPATRAVELPWFMQAMRACGPCGPLPDRGEGVRVLRKGEGRGRLWGGTISVFGHLMATRWAPDLRGAVIVLEGVGLTAANIHRWLQTLRLQGWLGGLQGMVLGTWADCFKGERNAQSLLEDLVLDACAGTDFPIIQLDCIGHEMPNAPWAVGSMAEVSAAGPTLLR
jgi:muramoyltetrapeptide carboxypeptidase